MGANINIEKGISDEFEMLDTGLDEINFYIEGVSSDGTVFSQLVKLETRTKNKEFLETMVFRVFYLKIVIIGVAIFTIIKLSLACMIVLFLVALNRNGVDVS